MKGKGHEVTARNIAMGDAHDECRPLTTDPEDNVLLIEDGYCSLMTTTTKYGIRR